MADNNSNVVELKPRMEVSMDGETLFNLDDIIGVNQHVEELRHMKVPEDAPQIQGVKKTALPDHVRKVQIDVGQWDGILVDMGRLANDLNSFSSDSLEALDQLKGISDKIQNDFDKLSDKEKEGFRGDMEDIFKTLYENTQSNEGRSQAMADKLGSFARLLGGDSATAQDLREKYQDYITAKEREIEEWEKTRGLTPSGDLIKDLNARIDEINRIIKQKEEEYIAAASGAGAAGAMSLIPVFWIVSIPGMIVGTVFACIRNDELKGFREEIQSWINELAKARELNEIKLWFESQKKTFDDLKEHLNASQNHVDNLRGQWQTLANDLKQLIGDTGKLKGLKKDAWLEPISNFRKKTAANVYIKVKNDTAVLQKFLFTKIQVEELKPAA